MVLSPFLNESFISENFNQVGNIPQDSDLLQTSVTGELINAVVNFKVSFIHHRNCIILATDSSNK
jgi:hypothetical protein